MIRLLSQREPRRTLPWRILWPDPEQLPRIARRYLTAAGAEREALAARFSKVISSIRVGNTWKRTRPARLSATIAAIRICLDDPPPEQLRVMDLGASDGVTTVEMVSALRGAGVQRVSAVLVDLHLRLQTRSGLLLREYASGADSPVLVRCGPFALPLDSVAQSRDPLSRMLGRWYLSRRTHAKMRPGPSIPLVHPAAEADADIEPVEWNAFSRNESWTDSFDIVRAANFLNLNYFSHDQLRLAISHIHAYLREGGVLVVSRDEGEEADATEHGTAWRKEGGGFRHVLDFGGGTEIRQLVDEFAAAAAGQGAGSEA